MTGGVQVSRSAGVLSGGGTEHLVDSSPSSAEDVVEDLSAGDVDRDGELVALGTHGSSVTSAVDESDGSSADVHLDGLSFGHVRSGRIGPCVVSRTEQHRDVRVVRHDHLGSLGACVGRAGTVSDQTACRVPDFSVT